MLKINYNLEDLRGFKVVKSNDLIQKTRFNLSLQEQKIVLYLISKIKPEDMDLKEYTFEIRSFLNVCGITNGGESYRYIKRTLKGLRDKSAWVTLEDGSETTVAWIGAVTVNKRSGSVKIKIDESIKPYLLQLQECFTQYELLYALSMRSQYSVRLYELLKSYEYRRGHKFDINDLKRKLFAENYERYPDFRRFVLDVATKEINDLSDITVSYKSIKTGRKYGEIEFAIHTKKDLMFFKGHGNTKANYKHIKC